MNDRTDLSDLAINRLIGDRYQLTRLLRTGGMGQIYLAEDTRLFQRQVVVKLLSLRASEADHQLRRWFANEAQISIMLGDHPRIVKVLDYGLDQERPYMVMEYLSQGCDLEEYLKTNGPLTPAQVVHLGCQICSGLAYAHQFTADYEGQQIRGVIHRDLKPSNLFILRQDILGETVKILDFGIAKILDSARQRTESKVGFVGTPSYASPEQIQGEKLTPSSDIYSLGVVLYKMLTGDLPLHPSTPSFKEWYIAHTQREPIPFSPRLAASIPPALQDLVMSCLHKDPLQRPASMQDLMQALESSLEVTPILVGHRSPSSAIPTQKIDASAPTLTRPILDPAPTLPGTPVVPELTPQWQEQIQQQLTPVLTRLIGPIASIVIRETLKSRPSPQEVVQRLAASVPQRDQQSFITQAQALLGQGAGEIETRSYSYPLRAASPQTAPARDQITQELSQLIGPMADVLVERALTLFPDMTGQELIDYLTTDLPSQPAIGSRERLSSLPIL